MIAGFITTKSREVMINKARLKMPKAITGVDLGQLGPEIDIHPCIPSSCMKRSRDSMNTSDEPNSPIGSVEDQAAVPNKRRRTDYEPKPANKGYVKGKFQKHARMFTHTGVRGILMSCTQNREAIAITELLKLLHKAKELLKNEFPQFETFLQFDHIRQLDAEGHHQQEYHDTIKKIYEVQSSSTEAEPPKHKSMSSFQVYDASCQGLVFVGIRHEIDPVLFLSKMMKLFVGPEPQLVWSKQTFIERLLPVQKICHASLEEMKTMLKPTLEQYLSDAHDPTSWGIVTHHRNNPNVNRQSIIDTVASLVPDKHPVDLKNPKYHILIEVIKSACCVSVTSDFVEFAKYNPTTYVAAQQVKLD